MNIATLLARSAAVHGTQPALAYGEHIDASYAEFFSHASRLAAMLQQRFGVAPGDRIALFCSNHRGYLEAMYAGWIAGAVLVPVNAKLHPREAAYILAHSEARICWSEADRMAELQPLMPGVQLLDIEVLPTLRAAAATPMAARTPDDLAWLFYTSGTTGRPKGVMLSHGNLLQATLSYLADVVPVALGQVLLHAAPMSHGSGLYNFAYVARAGINLVPASRGFDAAEVLQLARTYPGVSLFAAPTMVKRLVPAAQHDPAGAHSIGTIVYGGGPMYLADLQQALTVFGPRLVQIYGQGEAPMTITVLPRHVIADSAHPRHLQRLASVGHAQMPVAVSVRSEAGEPLPHGQIGEVCVCGPVVMQGYWRNPEATAQTLRDGWLCTGDMGVLDADGFLTLKDRIKDVIISGGSNIYPREVEEALLLHPGVTEVSVVGMADDEWGECVVAFVVAHGVTPHELDALCLAHIARFKRPKHYRFLAQLPKNNYGKVLKTELRAMLAP